MPAPAPNNTVAPSRILGVIAVGSMIGAAGRYVLAQAWPTPMGGFPWATFTINITGCFALGVLMASVVGREHTHPLARPFLGTGLIGGYTTFSTYAVEADILLQHHHPALGLSYLWASVLAGLAAALAGYVLTARIGRARA